MSKLFIFLMLICSTYLFGSEEIFSAVFKEHLKSIQHIEQPNPPQLILFSDSFDYIAQKIEKHFKAIRLNTDEAKTLFISKGIPLNLIDDYLDFCLFQLPLISPNRTIILDQNRDRYAMFAKKYGYQTYLVSNHDQPVEPLLEDIKNRRRFKSLINGTEEHESVRQQIIEFANSAEPIIKLKPSHFSQILPGLYLSGQINADLLAHDLSTITDMLTLRVEVTPIQNPTIRWKGIALLDHPLAKIDDHFQETYDFIEKTNEAILIHCKKGVSRSAAIVISYLMRKFNLPFSIAFNFVKKKHPPTNPNKGFVEQLMELEKANLSVHFGIMCCFKN